MLPNQDPMTERSVHPTSERPIRVFVVEDQSLVRLMLVEMLTELGHTVVAEAYKFENAARYAQDGDYQVAILDLNLGDGARFELIDMVRSRGKGLLIATGYGASGLPPEHADCVVLQKPYTEEHLAEALSRVISTEFHTAGSEPTRA